MIIFEEQLQRITDILPPYVEGDNSFPIRYNWGTIDVLNKYLTLPESVAKYPLIWLSSEQEDTHDLKEPCVQRDARIIIATRSLNKEQFNQFQYQNDYDKVLQPICDNLIEYLVKSGIAIVDQNNIRVKRMPNYSLKEEGGKIVDVWNAIVLDVNLKFVNVSKCINDFKK